jgi:hypothetical protein
LPRLTPAASLARECELATLGGDHPFRFVGNRRSSVYPNLTLQISPWHVASPQNSLIACSTNVPGTASEVNENKRPTCLLLRAESLSLAGYASFC